MARELSTAIQTQIDNKRVDSSIIFKINGVDRANYLLNYDVSYDVSFGSATASFVLSNVGGLFGESGAFQIYVGDIVELIEKFYGDSTEFKKFYGVVEQRSITKDSTGRTIILNCLDYISLLQKTDIDLLVEGDKILVEDETLTPNYLPAPNDSLAQIFNFANNAIANEPPPTLTITPKSGVNLVSEELQYDGFDIKYQNGQVLLGTPLNALYNYNLVARSYYFYVKGKYAEDIIEEILTQPDGYGKYMFGEASAQDVIDNHLKDTFETVEGNNEDTLTPNLISSDITIETQLTQDYDPDGSGDTTTIHVTSTDGFPSSGTGEVNGDSFTWTGKTSTTLTGVSGLLAHAEDSYVKYEATYEAGQVWYLSYSNIQGALTEGNFSGIDSGVSIDYIDYRFGRIILSSAISINSTVRHTGDYTFKTLQASGVELNKIRFTPRNTPNRFEAINRVREFLAPNYIIRTRGDNKIWSSYLNQKVNYDYELNLATQMVYLEDEDLYTRVVFFGKNINPTNITHRDGVEFVSSEQEFKASATQTELQFEKTEGGFHIYKTTISDAGRIIIEDFKPVIYINNVPVNDKPQLITLMPVVVIVTTRTETQVNSDKKDTEVTTRQYFYYKVRFAHTSIDPTQTVTLYDAVGTVISTLAPNDGSMDYANGIWNVPGDSQNSQIEQISSASYTVFYSTTGVDFDYTNVRFKVATQFIPDVSLSTITATFQYLTAVAPIEGISKVIDGRFDTQVQVEFFAEPPSGLPFAILDLGQIYEIQAIDMIAGFYRPDEIRKFDVKFKFTIYYSDDNSTYSVISDKTADVTLSGGESVQFEQDELGESFMARYLRFNLEDVQKLEFRDGIWPVAITELAVYDDIILKAEAKLIPTTTLSEDVLVESLDSSGEFPTTFTVEDASYFEIPESGETATAYIDGDSFTYTGIESGNTFVGVEGLSEDHLLGSQVTQSIEDDTSIYDVDGLLPKLGDRLFKEIRISDDILYDQSKLNLVAKAWLEEFYKNHTKIQVDVLYAPYLEVGQTIRVTDAYNDTNTNYFIENVSDRGGYYSLVLARYPE